MKTRGTKIARKLRREQTDVDRLLWGQLRDRRLAGAKFRRQVPIAGYVADFLCMDAKLIVEVDGSQHFESEADLKRTDELDAAGFRLLRFWNNEVMTNMDGVLQCIAETLEICGRSADALPPHPVPLPKANACRSP